MNKPDTDDHKNFKSPEEHEPELTSRQISGTPKNPGPTIDVDLQLENNIVSPEQSPEKSPEIKGIIRDIFYEDAPIPSQQPVKLDVKTKNAKSYNASIEQIKCLVQSEVRKKFMEKWLNTNLTGEEVLQARKRIDELYPLRKIKMEVLFPALRIFSPCFERYRYWKASRKSTNQIEDIAKSQKLTSQRSLDSMKRITTKKSLKLRSEILQQLEIETNRLQEIVKQYNYDYEGTMPIEDAKVLHRKSMRNMSADTSISIKTKDSFETFQTYGYGTLAYLRLIYALFVTFAVISVIMIPTISIYASKDGFRGKISHLQYLYSVPTIGNLGSLESQCKHQQIENHEGHVSKMTLKCEKGTLSQVLHSGIIPTNSINRNFCGDPNLYPEINKCSQESLNTKIFHQEFQENCKGKQRCQILMDKILIGADNECQEEFSMAYAQFKCSDKEHQKNSLHIGLFVTISGILGCFIFRFTIYYLKITAKMDDIILNTKSVTTSDFSVKITIPLTLFQKWKKQSSDGEKFKDFFKKQIEDAVSKIEVQFKCQHTAAKISSMHMSYDNQELIRILLKRGQFLTGGKYEELKKIESQIIQLLDDKAQKFSTPVAAFVIFETQENKERCLEAYETQTSSVTGRVKYLKNQLKVLDEALPVEQTSEPSNIIWENQAESWVKIFVKGKLVQLFITIFMLIMLIFISILSAKSNEIVQKYPIFQDCNEIKAQFQDLSEFERYATFDKSATIKGHGLGQYQCFCESNLNMRQLYLESKDGFCKEYLQDTAQYQTSRSSLVMLVVLINFIVKFITIILVEKVGNKTFSAKMGQISRIVMQAQFINQGFLSLLSNANFNNTPLSFLGFDLGAYNDFSKSWYLDVGAEIVEVMMIQAFIPYFQMAFIIAIIMVKRYIDSGNTMFDYLPQTKSITVQQFMNNFAGPEVKFDQRYSFILVNCFITFQYGLAMPILFPIAMLSMINLLISEKILLAYFYIKPRMYGNEMNESALEILEKAPIYLLVFGFWQMGNRQIFFNESSDDLNFVGDRFNPQHSLFHDLNHTYILLAVLPIFLFFNKVIQILRVSAYLLKIWSPYTKIEIDEQYNILTRYDEHLGSYWNLIPGQSQFRWFTKELYLQKALGIQTLSSEGLQKLKTSKRGKKCISNLINYDILVNPRYIDNFFYIQMDRRQEMETSDFVARAVYFGEQQ